MESKDLAEKIVEILESKKGIDIEIVDVTGKTTLADYFVIASGNSTTQIKALADEVEFILKKDLNLYADHVEGRSGDRWTSPRTGRGARCTNASPSASACVLRSMSSSEK